MSAKCQKQTKATPMNVLSRRVNACELANSTDDPRDRADYATLAYTWLKLARIFEHDNAMLARWGKDPKVVPLGRRRHAEP